MKTETTASCCRARNMPTRATLTTRRRLRAPFRPLRLTIRSGTLPRKPLRPLPAVVPTRSGATRPARPRWRPALDPGNIVVTGGNDSAVHAMSAANEQRNYQPGGASGVTGGTIQTRPPLIAASDTSHPTCKNACAVAYVAAGDGTVYAFHTDIGGSGRWECSLPAPEADSRPPLRCR